MVGETGYMGGSPSTGVEALYRDRGPAMVKLAYLLIGSHPVAQDLVHDAFVEVARRWDTIADPPAYLRRAVVNRTNSTLRRWAVERRWRWREEGRAAVVSVDRPEELWDALATLVPRQRAAIVLRFYADVPDDEVAALLGVRPATVRSLVHRGLTELRKVVEP